MTWVGCYKTVEGAFMSFLLSIIGSFVTVVAIQVFVLFMAQECCG